MVYRALDHNLGREIALKVLPLHPEKGREALKRFVLEARTLARLDHPGITSVYAHGRAGEVVYIASQLVNGVTLTGMIARDGPIEWDRALRIAREIASALEAAHDAGVLHRDIKSDNVMVDASGRVKVLDFGIARDFRSTHRITQDHHSVGTAEYCSPEQLRAEELDARADLYSLGVVLYEMLTGKVPHQGRSTVELYENIRRHAPRSPRAFDPGIPRGVVALARRLLNRNRDRRFAGAAEVRRAIDAILDRHERTAGPAGLWARWLGHPGAARPSAAVGLFLAAGVTAAAALVWVIERLRAV